MLLNLGVGHFWCWGRGCLLRSWWWRWVGDWSYGCAGWGWGNWRLSQWVRTFLFSLIPDYGEIIAKVKNQGLATVCHFGEHRALRREGFHLLLPSAMFLVRPDTSSQSTAILKAECYTNTSGSQKLHQVNIFRRLPDREVPYLRLPCPKP